MSAAQGWQYSIVGPQQQPFARPPPQTLDPLLLDDFAPQLNLLQDVSSTGENMFSATSEQASGAGREGCQECRRIAAPGLQPMGFDAPVSTSTHVLCCPAPQPLRAFSRTACLPQYVATLHSAFVEGEAGLAYDTKGHVFHPPNFHFNRTSPLAPMPQRTPPEVRAPAGISIMAQYQAEVP